MTTTTIEMVTYKLREGIKLDQLRKTHEKVNAFCQAQPGFLYRSLSQDENNTWHDIVYWQNMENAKAAGEAFMANEAGQSLVELCDNDSVVMKHMLADTEAMSCNNA